jgi:hypothetical protein
MTRSRNSDSLERRAVWMRCVVATAASIVLAASWIYAPWSQSGPVLCPLRLLTGIPCPSCGLTRSFCAAAHGDFSAAFGFHVIGPILFAATAIAIPLCILEVVRGRRFEGAHRVLFSSRVAWFEAGVFVAYHLWRLIAQIADGELARSMKTSALGTLWGHFT